MRSALHLAVLTACAVGGLALASAAGAQSYGGGYGNGYAPSYGGSAYSGGYVTSTYARPYEVSRAYAAERYSAPVSYGSYDSYDAGYAPTPSYSYGASYSAPSYSTYGGYAPPPPPPRASYGYAPADDCQEARYPGRRY